MISDTKVVLIFILVLLLVIFAGCASAPQTVEVPVAKSCLVEIDNKPTFPDTKEAILAAGNIAARVNLILAGRLLRDKRIDDLEAALSGCS